MMPESTLRTKERFSVTLNATYGIKGEDIRSQECQIANLSSSGARVRFPGTESLKTGAVIVMDIAIPHKILPLAAEGEIIWTKQRFNEFISGIRFTGALNEGMIQQVINTIPQLNDYTELIW
jgi:hypothetical protein